MQKSWLTKFLIVYLNNGIYVMFGFCSKLQLQSRKLQRNFLMKTWTIFKPGICRFQAKKCKETKEGDTIFIHADLCKFMEGSYFEQFIAEIYSFLGYDISWTKTTGDQGLDLIANRKVEDGTIERIGIQCKRYNGKVENSAVGICRQVLQVWKSYRGNT